MRGYRMKKFMWLTFLFLFIMSGSIAGAEPVGVQEGDAYIPNGTNIAVELTRSVNSKNTFVGEVLEIRVLENIVMNNTVVIEKGAMGYVTVSEVKRPGDWGKSGGVAIQPQYVKSTNWIKVPLTNSLNVKGRGHNVVRPFGTAALGTAGGDASSLESWAGTAIGGLFLLYVDPRPGKDAEIPQGTKFIVNVAGDVDLKVTPEEIPLAMTAELNKKTAEKTQNWTGTYSSSRGHIVLTQSGNTVTGNYDTNNGKLVGTVDGNKLTGTWEEESSALSPSGKGFFEFILSPAGTKVLMSWRNDYSANWKDDRYSNRLSGW